MKFQKIAVAVAALVAAASSHAALSAGEVALLDGAQTQILYVAGASAVQKGFETLVGNLLDNPVYFNNDGSTALNGSGYMAVAGTLKADAGNGATKWAAGSKVIIQYRNSGGSIYGVNFVVRTTSPIAALSVTSANCGSSGLGTSTKPYACATTTAVPDAGISDVHPRFFTAPYNVEGETPVTQLTSTELGKLTIKTLYAQAFGIPVSNTVPASTLFNRATISAIMTGGVSNWNQVPTDGTDSANPVNAGNANIVICRRIPGSGSQAVMNMWSAGVPCSSNANAPLDRDNNAPGVFDLAGLTYTAANAPAGTSIIIENNSSSDVRKCLDAAVNGGTYKTTDRASNALITVNFGSGGYKAIGVLSLDSLASSRSTPDTSTSPATGQWQFRALNGAGMMTGEAITTSVGPTVTGYGILPTIENLRTGNWDMQGWTTMQYLTTLSAPKKALVTQFIAQAQSVTTMQAAKELKWTAAIIPTGSNAGSQTLNVGYAAGNQCAPLSRAF